jgi:nitrate/nitrite transporter NarK
MAEAAHEPHIEPVGARLPIFSVLVPFALIFGLCNYYRTVNAVLAPDLISAFQLTAGRLGFLISIYFFVSALFQVPLGLLMDRFGPRRVQAVLILTGGCGVLIFALGTSWPVLLTGRVVMGIGAAGGLMTAIQAVTLWFPNPRWPFFNGIVFSTGAFGALMATLPTRWLLDIVDWHHLLVGVAVMSFLASAWLFFGVPERVRPPSRETLGQQIAGMGTIYRDRLFWRFAPLYLVTIGSTIAFQSLWAGPWLYDVAKFTPTEVAAHLLVMSFLQVVSYFSVGWVATELSKRNIPVIYTMMIGSAIYILMLTPLLLSSGMGVWSVLLGVGLFSNTNTLSYSILSRHFPATMTGRATTALNSFFFVGAFFVQFMVGAVIDLVPADTPGHYPALAYQLAFAVMIVLQICGWAWCLIPVRTVAKTA